MIPGAGMQEACDAMKEALSFEEALAQLEVIVTRLETGALSLGDSLQQFEEGIRLSRYCARQLEEAEARIEILQRDADGWKTLPIAEEIDDEE